MNQLQVPKGVIFSHFWDIANAALWLKLSSTLIHQLVPATPSGEDLSLDALRETSSLGRYHCSVLPGFMCSGLWGDLGAEWKMRQERRGSLPP